MFRSYFFLSLFLAGALLCPVQAQETEHDDYLDSGEDVGLVITASRTPESVAVVPAQIAVITADDIAESGATNVVDVLEAVPGVHFSSGISGAGSEAISMRGFGANSYGRVLILVDGNKINDPDMSVANWNAIPLSDIERIEILDGSASVQYGNNAVGGVINIITKKGGKRRTLIGVSGGSFFTHRESLFHFQPFSRGNLSFSAEYVGTKGYRERQKSRAANITSGANVFLGDNLTLSLNSFFSYLYFQLPGGLDKAHFKKNPKKALKDDYSLYPDINTVDPNFDDENTERHFGGGVGLQWFPTENVELNLPLSYRGKLIRMDMASWGSFANRTKNTAEARPQGSVTFDIAGMPLRLLGGIDVDFAKLEADFFSGKDRATKQNASYSISQWTVGPYLLARFSPLPDTFAFTTGIRYDIAKVNAEKKSEKIDDSKVNKAFVYEGGVVFNPLETAKLYAKYSTLFRYPFVDEMAQVSGWGDKFNTDLKPEKGFNAEIGAAYWFGKILDINANFFYMGLKDEINWIGGTTQANVNLDRTRHMGTNVGFTFAPVELLFLNASYSYVSAIFTAGFNKSNRIPLVPAHKLYIETLVKLPFGLDFGPNFEFASRAYGGGDDANTQEKMDSQFLFGARVRYVIKNDDRELAFQISAKNLLNKQYATVYSSVYYPMDGRSLDVSLQYRF